MADAIPVVDTTNKHSCTQSSLDNGADLPSAGTDFSALLGLTAPYPLVKRAARATPCYVPIVRHVLFLPVIKPPPRV